MQLSSFIDPDLVFHQLSSSSKKRLFEEVAQAVSEKHPGLVEKDIFDGLFERERLGSTGIGAGVAVPHCRLQSGTQDSCALVTLETPIGFDAPDGKPVDLLVFLVVDGDACQAHLDRLAAVSRYFSEAQHREQVRQCDSTEQLRSLILDS